MADPSPGSLAPYTERNSSGVPENVESLFTEPEMPLSDEEKLEVQNFATGLFTGKLGGLTCETPLDLEQLRQRKPSESLQSFYLGYFSTQKAAAEDLVRLGLAQDDASIVTKTLSNIDLIKTRVDEKTRKEIATRSLKWYKQDLADRLKEDSSKDGEFVDQEPLRINYEPQKLLDKITSLQAYRRFYREVRKGLKAGQGGSVNIAEHALLDMHVARVNEQLAGLYPYALYLGQQLSAADSNKQNMTWSEQLTAQMPFLQRAVARDRGNQLQDFKTYKNTLAQRLDFLKHGAAQSSGAEGFSPISPELRQLISDLVTTSEAEAPPSRFSPEVLEKLDTTKWNAAQMKDFLQFILRGWGLLSDQTSTWDEVEKRDGWPEDKKWQVATHPRRESFASIGAKHVVWIPESFDRSLTQLAPAGALPVAAHELEHLQQEEYNTELAKQVSLAQARGRRHGTLQEAGAIREETKVQAMFGRLRPTNAHYFKALETKLRGGNKLEASRAYYDSRSQGAKPADGVTQFSREVSVDRASRLFNNGGYSSQPLDYIEQALLVRELERLPESQAVAVMTAATSFSLKDAARLHRLGLLEIPREVRFSPADEVMRVFVEKYLPDILDRQDNAISTS